ncbi:hypothetical protein H2200_012543 [Cladophialophora chaetospira]|uniref:Uncharacterized protein n=1 Tax=Cladophialophora chaetospira TaxID=386627 RepID=A0AA39CC15_9EURO|nr:hypothetical protein H2200_012543 [Cladophialophora chaetospira]
MDTTETQVRKEKKGFHLVWRKLKAIFTTKPTITQSTTATTTRNSAPVGSAPHTTAAAIATHKQDSSLHSPPAVEVDDTPGTSAPEIEASVTSPNLNITGRDSQTEIQMRSTRVEAIFARYNLDLDETEWDRRPKVPHERVHKNIRMRVRYTCHNCSTTFGRERLCAECQHRRCTRCTRYPPRRDRPKVSQEAQMPHDVPVSEPQLDAPRQSAEGGICHECQTGFEIEVEECPNCRHKICDRCIHEASIMVEPGQDAPSQPAQGAASEREPEHRTATQDDSTALS